MLPTTSSDPEGFRSRPIAFWKALEPLSKAYISTSTLHRDLRIQNGHTACGCERGYRRRRESDGAAETDVAEAGAYGHLAPNSLTPTRKVASLMVTSLSAVASAEGQWRRMVSMGQRHMCQNESPEMAPAEVVALLAGASIVIESLAASGEGSGDSGPAEQPEACEQPWSDAGE